jgi:hypothetical protein
MQDHLRLCNTLFMQRQKFYNRNLLKIVVYVGTYYPTCGSCSLLRLHLITHMQLAIKMVTTLELYV